MAQAGFTPISLYYSTTASAAPIAGNLVSGELAINITDGKLFYKDNLGVVKSFSSTTSANLAGGIASQIPYQTAANTTAFIANGTAGQILTSNGTSAPSWQAAPASGVTKAEAIAYSMTLGF
jgi:hypothetical protein